MFRAAREFEAMYIDCVNADKTTSKHYKDYKDRMTRQMLKFNGKSQGIGEVESISETTTTEKKMMIVKSAMKQPEQKKPMHKNGS